ncbi:ABC transporter ATP-binding protein [Kitasatospora sp. NPDC051853]|uniref:ABC transporter ATP-binding protein n=1 Tax=Kitasatospora sp. NPDC051853 TaxID=3364058 RepID=UPI0037B1B1BB
MKVEIDAVSVEIAGARLVHEATLKAASGQVIGLVGPNGSGKSTLLRTVYRALRPSSGTVLLDGEDLHGLTPREGARRVGALPQETVAEFDFTVAEVVGMGRLPHRRGSDRPAIGGWRRGAGARTSPASPQSPMLRMDSLVGTADARTPTPLLPPPPDRRSVPAAPGPDDLADTAAALARVGAAHLAGRGFLQLSGGEKQRVLIARALVQRPHVLVLDEPTNHLDIAHQLEVLALVRESGLTVLTALHDLNLAAAHCDLLYVIAGGRIVTSGPPGEVLSADLLAEVFGVRAHPVRHPVTGAVQLLFDRLTTDS